MYIYNQPFSTDIRREKEEKGENATAITQQKDEMNEKLTVPIWVYFHAT